MKYSAFLKLIRKNGWQLLRQGKGSHEIWEKHGKKIAVPNHEKKEIPKGLEKN